MEILDTYEKLENYIRKEMKPSKSRNYQSVMIMTLNKNDGKATKKEERKKEEREKDTSQ